jgi:hypothetical protein
MFAPRMERVVVGELEGGLHAAGAVGERAARRHWSWGAALWMTWSGSAKPRERQDVLAGEVQLSGAR